MRNQVKCWGWDNDVFGKSFRGTSIHSYSSVFLQVQSFQHHDDVSYIKIVFMTYAHTLHRDSHLCSVFRMRGKYISPLISYLIHKVMDISLMIITYAYKHSCLVLFSVSQIHDLLSMASNIMLRHLYFYIIFLEWIMPMIFRYKLFQWALFSCVSDGDDE